MADVLVLGVADDLVPIWAVGEASADFIGEKNLLGWSNVQRRREKDSRKFDILIGICEESLGKMVG